MRKTVETLKRIGSFIKLVVTIHSLLEWIGWKQAVGAFMGAAVMWIWAYINGLPTPMVFVLALLAAGLVIVVWRALVINPPDVVATSGSPLKSRPAKRTYDVTPVRPYTRSLFACSDGTAFRERQRDEAEVVLTVAMFNSNAPILSTQLLYAGPQESMVLSHGCWMNEQFGCIKPEMGRLCELILAATADSEHTIIDDRRSFQDPQSKIGVRSLGRGRFTVTVSFFLGDDLGPEFVYQMDAGETVTATLMPPVGQQARIAESLPGSTTHDR
ncbi:MAG: hypothetical protein ABSD56_07060 [Bryobacteraceae bacterium]